MLRNRELAELLSLEAKDHTVQRRRAFRVALAGRTTRYQLEACRAFAEAQGYEVVAELVDESVSSRLPMIERLAGNEMVEQATRGRCDVVLVFRFDRIARNSADLISTDRVLRAAGVAGIDAGVLCAPVLPGLTDSEESLDRVASGR